MNNLALVMPMAGNGSRFRDAGCPLPKPMIDLLGKPFFWWAVRSVARTIRLRELRFVVLREHVRDFAIDAAIAAVFPDAGIEVIDAVTGGAAETAAIGIAGLAGGGPVAVNDCDHAFDAHGLDGVVAALQSGAASGALLGFRSRSPAYSYVRFDGEGRVAGTVEKVVASPFAIAGCYLFADADSFARRFDAYRAECTYKELFLSGVYNGFVERGETILFHELATHVSFGTPEELARVQCSSLEGLG